MKKTVKLGVYTICFVIGITISTLYGKVSNNNVSQDMEPEFENLISKSVNSGLRFTICKDKDLESKNEKLTVNNNSLKFYLNINNYSNYLIQKNNMIIFINNKQVDFSINNNIFSKSNITDFQPGNNCFEININNLNLNNNQNNLLVYIVENSKDYDITNKLETNKNNKTHCVNKKIFNSSIKENINEEYETWLYEENSDIKDGIYINKMIHHDNLIGSSIIKAKPNENIQIPIVLKNQLEFDSASLMFLINDEQYKIDDNEYINILLNNDFPKTKLLNIITPNNIGKYKINTITCFKNSKNNTEKYEVSNTINLILE